MTTRKLRSDGEISGFGRFHPARTGLDSVPMPLIETTIWSPARSGDTPDGVPVISTSPGSRVITALT